MAENLQIELAKLEDVGLTYIAGGRPDQIRVEPDPEKLALYGMTLQQLIAKVQQANRSFLAGRIRDGNRSVAVAAGQTLSGIPDIGLLLIGIARRPAGLCARRRQHRRRRQAARAAVVALPQVGRRLARARACRHALPSPSGRAPMPS